MSRRSLALPLVVAAVVAMAYGLWLRSYIAAGGDIRTFVHVGQRWIDLHRGTPTAIHLPPGFPVYTGGQADGYDGQWVYYIARDPLHAYTVLDTPTYRYVRILLPLTVHAVSLGRETAIPGALVGVNLFWIVVGTGALAIWLQRRQQPVWLALAFGLYPGLFIVVQFDLTEAMAYGLVACGLLLLDVGGRRRRLLAGVALGLAALSRDLTVLFGLAYAAGELLQGVSRASWWETVRRNLPRALELGVPAVLPLLAWEVFVDHWLPAPSSNALALSFGFPLEGFWEQIGLGAPQDPTVQVVAIPALICAVLCVVAAYRRAFSPEWLALTLSVLIVVFMTKYLWVDFTAASRIATGVMLAAVLFVPQAQRLIGTRAWIWACTALWLTAMVTPMLLPDLRYLNHLLQKL